MSLNKTFVPGDVVTAADLNGPQAAWDAYTPTWTALTVNPTIGNGTLVGKYLRIGKLIFFRIVLTVGSTTAKGTGQWFLTLPVAPAADLGRQQFNASYYDSGAADRTGVATWDPTGAKLHLHYESTAGGQLASVGSGNPHVWGTSDQLVVAGTYEAA